MANEEEGAKVRDEPPKASKKEQTGITGPEPPEYGSPERQLPSVPSGIKEVREVPSEDLEEGSGPIVEHVVADHIRQAPRETEE